MAMKALHPQLRISFTFILFFAIAVVTAFIPFPFNVYASSFIILFITWWLYKKEGNNLSELGLNLTKHNTLFFPLGFLLGLLFFCLLFFLQIKYNGIGIEQNNNFNYYFLIIGFFICLPQVLLEEFIFRGYCFNKTVENAGIVKANIIFALLFIIWHWFALNAWGNWGMMLGLFTTGLGHITFATALQRSKTLYFPIGIHLGNNWVSRYIFSYQTKGEVNTKNSNDSLFYILSDGHVQTQWQIIVSYAITVGCFIVCIAAISCFIKQKDIKRLQSDNNSLSSR